MSDIMAKQEDCKSAVIEKRRLYLMSESVVKGILNCRAHLLEKVPRGLYCCAVR